MENLMIAPQYQEGESLEKIFLNSRNILVQENENRKKAEEILNFINLYQKRNEYVEDLASVEIKLLEVGRQMMTGAKLFLLDEPMSGISPSFQKKMANYIKDLENSNLMIYWSAKDSIVPEQEKNQGKKLYDIIKENNPDARVYEHDHTEDHGFKKFDQEECIKCHEYSDFNIAAEWFLTNY